MSGKAWIGLGIVAALLLVLTGLRAPTPPVPKPAPADAVTEALVCLDCHRRPNVNTNEGVVAARAFCMSCHGELESSRRRVAGQLPETQMSLKVAEASFAGSPHQYVACVQCHTDVARSPHQTALGAQCRDCHPVHGESPARTPHLRVDCQACHYTHEAVEQDPVSGRIQLAAASSVPGAVGRVNHALQDTTALDTCRRCHHGDNQVGAPATVLPSKSLLCIACHPVPLAIGHPLFGLAALILVIGLVLMLRFWFIGSVQGEQHSLHRKISLTSESIWQMVFSRKILAVVKTLLVDIILQRRLLKESVQRWSMHSLIFLAILVRFGLSLFTGILFALNPDNSWALVLINKDHPFTAFTYDFLGLLILLGIGWAVIQRFVIKPAHVVTEIKDNITLGLIGLLITLGFLTSGARILLNGLPADMALNAFISYPLAHILSILPLDWRLAYPWLWYAHALAGAAFIAYLPFGKLKHVFNVPLTYILEEVYGAEKPKRI